ncbi:hypothetical protein HOU00_gp113 [Caulobacter phage CcrPW]|uniref:Uncharacterized protein n=1 Tax=Caulobacter phage CcrPW TaxID=2283271 RepID=A0A385E9T0_9CAUD|nr:hypothetical protein HOU00_gp024 [Caulobacter phage CcrPW]YP_009809642.1 hypothetical protein HOU00_gp113 [Caulobacter phage CcrPW]AXQ68563.1 hypothetical protein CcrPW_gp024 [Caulobacter phage CcrPW]AXQ69012.1 hypothetical protein CcrPW_gp473 [Caulobacter phage CcrPW]
MPDYKTNDPKGYMGDPRRGAAMGRPTYAPDAAGWTVEGLKTAAALEEDRARIAEEQRENRPGDGYKRQCWEAAAASFRKEAERLRSLIPAARAMLAASPKITLQRVRLDSGGYDRNGTYFGHDLPLYWAADESGDYDATFRAADRNAAKAIVRETYPAARFYN